MTRPTLRMDPATLAPVTAALLESADDLEQGQRDLSHCAGSAGEEAFGDQGASAACRAFLLRWADEVGLTAGAARECGAAVRESINAYLLADADSARRLGSR